MDTENSTPSETRKIHRFQIGFNVLLQLGIVFLIVAMVNYLSFRHFKRWDYSRDQKFKLSSQTTNLLTHLKKPVHAVVFFSSAAEVMPDLQVLMREYEFQSKNKFTVEYVNPYRNLSRAQELVNKYKLGGNENVLILDYDERNKFVPSNDMVDQEMPDQMAMMTGDTQPRIIAFKGEQAITSALLELTEGKPNKIYYVTGHGELSPASTDLQLFAESVKQQNIQVAPLELLNTPSIPEDARALIINGPKYDFSEIEMKRIAEFWAKKGRFFVLLNAYARTPHLNAWLNEQGIVPQENRVIANGEALTRNDKGGLEVVKGIMGDPNFVVDDSHTKITKDLVGVSKRMLGPTQSFQANQALSLGGKSRIIPILSSAEGFWGETDLTSDMTEATFDPKKDLAGPLLLALAVEKGAVDDDRVKVETARLVVVGNSEMLTFNAARFSDKLSNDISVNALNWLLDREELIGIPPRDKKNNILSLEPAQLNYIQFAVMALIPGIVALLGLMNWILRRN